MEHLQKVYIYKMFGTSDKILGTSDKIRGITKKNVFPTKQKLQQKVRNLIKATEMLLI